MSRLRELRRAAGLSQKDLADRLFVNQTAVSQWERGVTTPNRTTLQQLCEMFNVPSDELLGIQTKPHPRGVKIPVLGKVQAGIPMEAIEYILDYEEISEDLAATGEFFALQIRGQSMEPRFTEGDVVIVRQQQTIETGEIAVVLVDGDDATIKKIKKMDDGIALIPTNPAFEPIFYSKKEINELPVTIIGRVVELRAKF